jgi:predicted nucleic acid-binding protein
LSRIVVDASSIGRALLPDEQSDQGEPILELLHRSSLVEPANWGIESAGLILKASRRGRLSITERNGLREALFMLIQGAEIETTVQPIAIFDLAVQHHISVYDAAYLDLALRSGLPLLAHDFALRDAASRAGVELAEVS